jgi:hypothetical protein
MAGHLRASGPPTSTFSTARVVQKTGHPRPQRLEPSGGPWIAEHGVIRAVHYPVFPSDADAAWVLDYLRARNASAKSSTAEA